MSSANQLVLDLPVRRAQGREDFFVAPANRAAVAMLDVPHAWVQHRAVLHGPTASGKTHLLNIWAQDHGAALIVGAAITSADMATLIAAPALAIDEADAIAGNNAAETALFHILNGRAAANLPTLLAGRHPSARWGIALPDLASRLNVGVHMPLLAPDDTMLAALLVKLFADRQIAVSADLVPYLVARIDRSCAAAIAVVARLDKAALARKSRLTVRFAGQILIGEI